MDEHSFEKIRSFASKNDFALSSHLLVDSAKRSLFWFFIERENYESLLENLWPLAILNNLEEDHSFKQYVVSGLAEKFKDVDYKKLCLVRFEKEKDPFYIKIIRVLNNYYSQKNASRLKNQTLQVINKLLSNVSYSDIIPEQEIFASICIDAEDERSLQSFALPDDYQVWKSKFPRFNKEGINIDLQNIVEQKNIEQAADGR